MFRLFLLCTVFVVAYGNPDLEDDDERPLASMDDVSVVYMRRKILDVSNMVFYSVMFICSVMFWFFYRKAINRMKKQSIDNHFILTLHIREKKIRREERQNLKRERDERKVRERFMQQSSTSSLPPYPQDEDDTDSDASGIYATIDERPELPQRNKNTQETSF